MVEWAVLEEYVARLSNWYRRAHGGDADDVYQLSWLKWYEMNELGYAEKQIRVGIQNAVRHFRYKRRSVVGSRADLIVDVSIDIVDDVLCVEPDLHLDTFKELVEELVENPLDRALVTLRDRGKTYAEIGELVGISTTTVRERFQHLRRDLWKEKL